MPPVATRPGEVAGAPTPAPARAAAAAPAPAPVAEDPRSPTPAAWPDPLRRGRELTGLLYGERLGELWAAFLPSARAEWRDLAAFQAYRAAGLQSFGREAALLHEAVIEEGGLTSYVRTATFEGAPGQEWTVVFRLDEGGRVQDFRIAPAAPDSGGRTN
ncbi:hypothetical protein [Deinococcus budaensis]|uniref:DUF3887 domain-containing protein n=1 Tax=Deinococcus budaensis TaxID=1665626 RepID=A0A7W8GE98_9DEIO|nr:hypothetical protein [Deinococcus budaensis]MBB5233908.1 hypothetical protein [Deinococcus budaensis]